MKKVLTMVMALVLTLFLSVVAFADELPTDAPVITDQEVTATQSGISEVTIETTNPNTETPPATVGHFYVSTDITVTGTVKIGNGTQQVEVLVNDVEADLVQYWRYQNINQGYRPTNVYDFTAEITTPTVPNPSWDVIIVATAYTANDKANVADTEDVTQVFVVVAAPQTMSFEFVTPGKSKTEQLLISDLSVDLGNGLTTQVDTTVGGFKDQVTSRNFSVEYDGQSYEFNFTDGIITQLP